jgi:hypothetical protein
MRALVAIAVLVIAACGRRHCGTNDDYSFTDFTADGM